MDRASLPDYSCYAGHHLYGDIGHDPGDQRCGLKDHGKTGQDEQAGQIRQAGNAMIYVLIVVALFSAITFVLSRQSNTGDAGALSDERAEILAGNIQQAAMAVKQAIEQMIWTGADIDDLDFTKTTDSGFNSGSAAHKVFHPAGGGMILPRIPDAAVSQLVTSPQPGWYIGRFNNVEWTPTTDHDVMLTAYQLSEAVCRRLNLRLMGSEDIPVMGVAANRVLVEGSESSPAAANIEFRESDCAECEGKPSLCVQDSSGVYAFYSIIAAQ